MSEIITGLASSVVTLTVAYFVFRKDDKANQLTYITDERRKWREKIRELSVTFMTGGKYNSLRNEELRDIREKVAVRLNPDDVEDKYILCLMDCYIENNCNLLKDKIRKKLSLAFASLLKHDWDRAKKETKMSDNTLKVILFLISLMVVTLIYSCNKCLPSGIDLKTIETFTDGKIQNSYLSFSCTILFVLLTLLIYKIFDFIVWKFRCCFIKKEKKECNLVKYLGIIIRKPISVNCNLKECDCKIKIS